MPPRMRKGRVHCKLEALGARGQFQFWGGLECGWGYEGREDEHEQDQEISWLELHFGLAGLVPGAVGGDAGRVGLFGLMMIGFSSYVSLFRLSLFPLRG